MEETQAQRTEAGRDVVAVVGIGASAGGLRALQDFFASAPVGEGLAYVVVQHLSPRHESELAELVQSYTELTVTQVVASTPVEPEHVYIIPPDRSLIYREGALHLAPRPDHRGSFSLVDTLFRSLAAELDERAVCVVLSGTGTDGTLGLRAVKESGGLTLVQDPSDAEYDGMPRSALATSLVDVCAPAAELAARIADVRDRAERLPLPRRPEDLRPDDEDEMARLIGLIADHTGHDFGAYKRPTLLRRIGRRVQLTGAEDLKAYVDRAVEDATELEALRKDLLISVTHFFRDADAFAALEEALADLLERREGTDDLRVWVPACATGEEAYSLAIVMQEALERLERPPGFQIFATDVDEGALELARRGVYPGAIAEDISPDRLERHFLSLGSSYRVRPDLRDRVLFAPHDVLKHPPFSRLDLVSCRNLLIYLEPSAQRRVVDVFHYALRPGGLLFLGGSELAEHAPDRFATVDARHRLYRSRDAARVTPLLLQPERRSRRPGRRPSVGPAPLESTGELHHRLLLERHTPPSLLVDERGTILHLHGEAGRYLEIGEGRPTMNVLTMARPGLRNPLRTALARAFRTGQATPPHRVRVALADGDESVELTVRAVHDGAGSEQIAQVVFERSEPLLELSAGDVAESDVVRTLEEELARTRSELSATVEELETSTQELNASNEELQSMNEELQSSNEELETSQEELQSTNEELVTLNQELKAKIDELRHLNDDLENLLSSTAIATLFLDRHLRVKRFTPAATEVLHLVPADHGRPFRHVAHRLDRRDLHVLAERVLRDHDPVQEEVEDDAGRTWILRLLPYRTLSAEVDGVVLTLVDITERRRAEQEVQANEQQLRLALDGAQLGVWRRDLRDGTMRFDERCQELFGVPGDAAAEEMLGRIPAEDLPAVEEALAAATDPASEDDRYVMQHRFLDHEGRTRWLTVRGLCRFEGEGPERTPVELFGVVLDVTETREFEEAYRDSERRYRSVFENVAVGVARVGLDGGFLELNDRYCEIAGRDREGMLAATFAELTHPDDVEEDLRQAQALAAGEIDHYRMDKRYLRPDGSVVWVRLSASLARDADGEPAYYLAVIEDITTRKEAERTLQRVNALLERRVAARTADLEALNQELTAFNYSVSHDLRAPLRKVAGFTRVLLEDHAEQLDAKGRAYLERVASGAEGMSEIIDALLMLSRLSSRELRPVRVDLSELAREVAEHLPERDEERGLELRIAPDLEARGDRQLLRMLLVNLLGNAFKYTREVAEARIEFSAEQRGGERVFYVRDNGAGFDPRYAERLFVPFARLHEEGRFEGTGIGLATVQRIVHRHGGRVWAEGSEGEGATVFFTLGEIDGE